MKIAILGTRGIPNNYGGFEQLAQCLSLGLVNRGHEVWVYNSHTHPYRSDSWKGVQLIRCYDPEKSLGTFGQFIYDFNCIRDARNRQLDVILNLGYTSSSVWMKLFPSGPKLITNMDGFEWQRSKYGKPVRQFLKFAEKWAVKGSDLLVADSHHIQNYLRTKYRVEPYYIAYGAELFNDPDQQRVVAHGWKPFQYNMIVARMEPENNIEMILDGVTASAVTMPFYVVGNSDTPFGHYLRQKYKSDARIVFVPPVFDQQLLNNLRYYSHIYFHGHSVGGTNPSLLEAMGCSCFIFAHDNQFNRAVLENNAVYFGSVEDIIRALNTVQRSGDHIEKMIRNNYDKILRDYSWEKIIAEYEELMQRSLTL